MHVYRKGMNGNGSSSVAKFVRKVIHYIGVIAGYGA